MAKLFLSENKFVKLKSSNNLDVKIVLEEMEESDVLYNDYNPFYDNSPIASRYMAHVLIDGSVAFSLHASKINDLIRKLSAAYGNSMDKVR
jgi:hypothetical protein